MGRPQTPQKGHTDRPIALGVSNVEYKDVLNDLLEPDSRFIQPSA